MEAFVTLAGTFHFAHQVLCIMQTRLRVGLGVISHNRTGIVVNLKPDPDPDPTLILDPGV